MLDYVETGFKWAADSSSFNQYLILEMPKGPRKHTGFQLPPPPPGTAASATPDGMENIVQISPPPAQRVVGAVLKFSDETDEVAIKRALNIQEKAITEYKAIPTPVYDSLGIQKADVTGMGSLPKYPKQAEYEAAKLKLFEDIIIGECAKSKFKEIERSYGSQWAMYPWEQHKGRAHHELMFLLQIERDCMSNGDTVTKIYDRLMKAELESLKRSRNLSGIFNRDLIDLSSLPSKNVSINLPALYGAAPPPAVQPLAPLEVPQPQSPGPANFGGRRKTYRRKNKKSKRSKDKTKRIAFTGYKH